MPHADLGDDIVCRQIADEHLLVVRGDGGEVALTRDCARFVLVEGLVPFRIGMSTVIEGEWDRVDDVEQRLGHPLPH